jgi:type IX secretion system PorP/SprF family membrane protein
MIMNAHFKYEYIKKILFAFVLFFTIGFNVKAQQEAMYTQYMFNGMAINPAYIAMDEMLAVTLLTRHQWVGFDGAPNTQTISFHTPYKTSNTFYGAILLRDNIGEVITQTGGNLDLTRRVKIGDKSWLALGVNAGLSYYSAYYSQTTLPSASVASDPVFLDQRGDRVNLGMGVMLFNKKYYFGISSPHFYYRDISDPRHNNPSTAYRPTFLMQSGGLFKLNGDFKFRPSVLFKYVDGSPLQFDFNTSVLIKDQVWFGTSYRYLDSFSILASVYLTPTILFGYAYDLPNYNVNSARKGSHELMFQFRLPVKGRDPLACYF